MPQLIFVNRYFHPDHSASSQMLTDLAFKLAEDHGFSVHVVTSRQCYEDPLARLPAHEMSSNVRIHRVWSPTFGREKLLGRALDYLGFYLTAFFKLLQLARRNDVVIAKTDPPFISVMAAAAVWLKSAILVNWIQDLYPEVAVALGVIMAKTPLYPILRRLRNFSLKIAATNVVIGEKMKEKLLGEGVAPERIRVIYNWADGAKIRPLRRDENPLRREWGLDGKFVVGYSGNFGRGHEFRTIMEAAAMLKERPEIVFLFIGGGANLEWVKSEAARLKLDNVLFKPYQPRGMLDQSLSAADVHLISLKPELEGLIVPSKFSGIAAAGRPAIFIGAADGEIAHAIEHDGCGYTCAPGDADGLTDRIYALHLSPELCENAGRQARWCFDRSFSYTEAVRQWAALLQQTPTAA